VFSHRGMFVFHSTLSGSFGNCRRRGKAIFLCFSCLVKVCFV
jgi:hypothetical protein